MVTEDRWVCFPSSGCVCPRRTWQMLERRMEVVTRPDLALKVKTWILKIKRRWWTGNWNWRTKDLWGTWVINFLNVDTTEWRWVNNNKNNNKLHWSGRLYWLRSEEATFEEQTVEYRGWEMSHGAICLGNSWYQSRPGAHFSGQFGSAIVHS